MVLAQDDNYFEAARQRRNEARQLYEQANSGGVSYGLCLYVAGVATECMLRAFRATIGEPIDDKHDFQRLLSERVAEVMISPKNMKEFAAAIADVRSKWKNTFRYRTDKYIERELRRIHGNTALKIKGSVIKKMTIDVLASMNFIIEVGEVRWAQLRQKK